MAEATITEDTVKSLAGKLERLAEGLPEDERVTLAGLLSAAGQQIRGGAAETAANFAAPSDFSRAFDASFGRLTNPAADAKAFAGNRYTVCIESA